MNAHASEKNASEGSAKRGERQIFLTGEKWWAVVFAWLVMGLGTVMGQTAPRIVAHKSDVVVIWFRPECRHWRIDVAYSLAPGSWVKLAEGERDQVGDPVVLVDMRTGDFFRSKFYRLVCLD